MSKRTMGLILVVILLLGLLPGCFGGKTSYANQGVCILDGTGVRSEPNKTGEWLTSLQVGETVKLKSGPIKDPADPKTEYIKVKLSDGKVGFASTWCIIQGSYVGVIQDQTIIYKRPDLLAETAQKFELMEIVAVQAEQEDWLQVVGEKRTKTGWIMKESIRKGKEDVVTAVLLRKATRGKESTLTQTEMEEIITKLPYPDNYFATKMMEKFQSIDIANPDQPVSPTPEGN
jgi:hypothetical protein